MISFPDLRLRRLRGTGPMRDLTRETRLSPREFVYPMFVTHGHGVREAIEPMPGCYQMSLDVMSEEVDEVASLGIPAVLLFGLPAEKDPMGSEGYDPEGIVQEAVRVIKKNLAGNAGHHRRLHVRVHRPRPLRCHRQRQSGQRPDPRAAGADRSVPRAGRGRHASAVCHDGRPGVGRSPRP